MPRLLLSIAGCLIGLSSIAGAGIINGSFESPDVPNGGFTIFAQGSTLIPGWTVVGIGPDAASVVDTNFTASGITFQAQDGIQWLDLAGYQSNAQTSGVSQSVATDVGARYALSFYVGSARDGVFFFPASADVSINGGARTRYTNLTAPNNMLNWQQFTHIFTATSLSTNITFYNGGASNNFLGALDNVTLERLNEVPEPASILLMLSSLPMGIAAVRRRRN